MSRWWSCSSRRVSSGSSQAFCRVVGKLFVEAEQFVVSEFFNVEVVEEFFNVKVVELFVEAGQFGFVAGLLSRRGEAVRRGGAVRRVRVLQHRGGERVLQLRGGGGGVRLRRDQAAARMPRPSTFFKASRLKISLLYMFE